MVSQVVNSNSNAIMGGTGMTINRKAERRKPKVGDLDFKPPDGGWGWLIVVACGFGNLCSFPMFHQFGLVFKEKFAQVGIDSSQTLTILNLCVAFNTGVGLLNGPLFRLFSQRQVAGFSACGIVISLIVLSFCTQFWSHIVMYSLCYGASFGLLEAANSLAINTYFKEKRRSATGYSWTLTGLGPIICPYIIVFLERYCGINGVIIIFAGIAMHSILCSLFLQPVEWHTEPRDEPVEAPIGDEQKTITRNMALADKFFANEGYCHSEVEPQKPSLLVGKETDSTLENSQIQEVSANGEEDIHKSEGICCTKEEDTNKSEESLDGKRVVLVEETDPVLISEPTNTLREKFCTYFDFDLMKDPTYLNLNLGLTFANVTEMNFSLATPIILTEFNFTKYEIANFMSVLAATDLIVRFISSVVADKIGWSNRTYFLIGVMSMAIGRVILVHTQTYTLGMFVAVVIGSGKALRTIFMILVIPSHVPLERLPAAYGLQFAVSGITFIVLGPVVGWIREQVGSYVYTLHILNILTYLTAISWTIDSWMTKRKKKIEDGVKKDQQMIS
ncbi:unnamed protein product [Phaedon cochleariae]|uniref:Major facilitator superfamily (MFS) profile domain-containing protein n=1 Tax=Phaedon cochleariae TaxID=80249 RepID=A0A9P0GSD2_PHACE|nr:unnamed protein product [Phaedon cochleariae]